VEKVAVNRDAGRSPLFDVMFALQNLDRNEIEIPGLKLKTYDYENRTAKFDLILNAAEIAGRIRFNIEYGTGLFKPGTVERFTGYFRKIVTSVLGGPGQEIGEIEIIPEAEKRLLLDEFNGTLTDYPLDKTIQELFAEQVEKTPDSMALLYRDSRLTYRELNKRADGLAHLLWEKGVKGDMNPIVGIMVERSLEMIIGILGILKAGGAYLPIETGFPRGRIQYMLADTGAAVLLATRDLPGKSETLDGWNGETVLLDEADWEVPREQFSAGTFASTLAYIIYTSGTTGNPRGVLTSHYNVTRVVRDTNYINITGSDRLLQLSNYAFDGSVFDIYGALLNSAALVLMDREDVLAIDRPAGGDNKKGSRNGIFCHHGLIQYPGGPGHRLFAGDTEDSFWG
jgi:non-ribosomal peptide synthetase component F